MSGVEAAVMEDLPGLMVLEASFPEVQRWSEDSWRDELLGAGRHVVVCRSSGGLDAAATFSLSGDVVDLHRIVTAPGGRRRGLARQLVDAGVDWAREVGASRMMLEVGATNGAAMSLYEAVGFRRIAERLNYYAPGAHAAVMERGIPAIAEGGTS